MSVSLFCLFAQAGLSRYTPLPPFFVDEDDIGAFLRSLREVDPGVSLIQFKEVDDQLTPTSFLGDTHHIIVKWSKFPSELFHTLENAEPMNKTLFSFLYDEMYRIIHRAAVAKMVSYDTTRYWETKFKEQVWEKFNVNV